MGKRSRGSSLSVDDDSRSDDTAESLRPPKLSAVVSMNDSSSTSAATSAIQCSLVPHRDPVSFSSVQEFELHYAKEHTNRCSACGKNFPTSHLLTLHTDEHHNTFREALQAKGEKTYACFVEDCDKLCSTPQKRRFHLIDKHLFPKIYNFRIVDTGIDKCPSMLYEGRRRRVSTITNIDQMQDSCHQRTSMRSETESKRQIAVPPLTQLKPQNGNTSSKSGDHVSDTSINELDQSMAALLFVPPSVVGRMRHKPS